MYKMNLSYLICVKGIYIDATNVYKRDEMQIIEVLCWITFATTTSF